MLYAMSQPIARATPPPGAVRFAVSGKMPAGGNWAEVFWFMTTNSGGLTIPAVQALGVKLLQPWQIEFLSLLASDLGVALTTTTFYGDAGLVITAESAETLVGGSTAATREDQVAVVVSWLVGSTWRGGKPRTYLPSPEGLASADTAHITAAAATTLQAHGVQAITDWNAVTSGPFLTCQFVCLRFFSKGAALVPPQALPVIGCKVDTRFDTQRRRLGKS